MSKTVGISQGKGNGLCGVYVWLNALDYFSDGRLSEREDLLEEACESLTRYGARYCGLTFANAGSGLDTKDIVALGTPAQHFARRRLKIDFGIERPFHRNPPAHLDDVWAMLRDAIAGPDKIAILGLENYGHYTLAIEIEDDRADARLLLKDSYGIPHIARIEMGLKKSRRTFNVDPADTLVLTYLGKPKSPIRRAFAEGLSNLRRIRTAKS